MTYTINRNRLSYGYLKSFPGTTFCILTTILGIFDQNFLENLTFDWKNFENFLEGLKPSRIFGLIYFKFHVAVKFPRISSRVSPDFAKLPLDFR